MRLSWLWSMINLFTALLTSVFVFVVPATPFQPYIVMSFVCFCPGMALVRFLRLNDLATELSLAVALSLSVASIIAGALLYSKHWSPLDTLTALILLTLICSIAQLIMQLPIIGIAHTQEQSDDVAASKTISMAALKRDAGKQQEVVKENTPQPLTVASSSVRKAPWGLGEVATSIIPVSTDQSPLRSGKQAAPPASHEKEIEKAATTILPAIAQPPTKQSVAEKDTTLLAAVSSSPGPQKVEEKDTTLLATVSNSPEPQKIEEKDTTLLPSAGSPDIEERNTTLLPSAGAQSIEEKDTALIPSPIETQDTQELHKEEISSLLPATKPPVTPKIEAKKTASTPPITKLPETPATAEKKVAPAFPPMKLPVTPKIEVKKAISTPPSLESQQPEDAKENTDKRPAVRPLQKPESRDRDTDANIEPASAGETPNSFPALPSPVGVKPTLRKRRLLNQ